MGKSVAHLPKFYGGKWWEGKSWHDVQHISYKGQIIVVEHYETVLQQKEDHIQVHGGTLGEKHVHDFRRAGRELGG